MADRGRFTKLVSEIRFLYVYHNIPIPELASKFNVSPNSIYTRKKREGWDLLKDRNVSEASLSRTSGIYDFRGESIGFWNDMLKKCEEKLDGELSIEDLEKLGKARVIAEDRKALFAKIELVNKAKEEIEVAGILNEIAQIEG